MSFNVDLQNEIAKLETLPINEDFPAYPLSEPNAIFRYIQVPFNHIQVEEPRVEPCNNYGVIVSIIKDSMSSLAPNIKNIVIRLILTTSSFHLKVHLIDALRELRDILSFEYIIDNFKDMFSREEIVNSSDLSILRLNIAESLEKLNANNLLLKMLNLEIDEQVRSIIFFSIKKLGDLKILYGALQILYSKGDVNILSLICDKDSFFYCKDIEVREKAKDYIDKLCDPMRYSDC